MAVRHEGRPNDGGRNASRRRIDEALGRILREDGKRPAYFVLHLSQNGR